MKKKAVVKKEKKEFALSEGASKLIAKMHEMIVREVTKLDKLSQKGKK